MNQSKMPAPAPAPGSRINVKVVKRPTSAAAQKTIVRLLRKDADVKKEDQRLRKARKLACSQHQRGGRPWDVHRPSIAPVKALPGVAGVLVASADVMRDLASVSRFVEVSPA